MQLCYRGFITSRAKSAPLPIAKCSYAPNRLSTRAQRVVRPAQNSNSDPALQIALAAGTYVREIGGKCQDLAHRVAKRLTYLQLQLMHMQVTESEGLQGAACGPATHPSLRRESK